MAQPDFDPYYGSPPAPNGFGGHPQAAASPAAVAATKGAPAPPDPTVTRAALSRPYDGYDGPIQAINFRRPTSNELIRVNAYPMMVVIGDDGKPVGVKEFPAIIAAYAILLAQPPIPPDLVSKLDMVDFRRVSTAVCDHFPL